jgi:guanylate kinase
MKIDLILLSGTPASGKDTLTEELNNRDSRFSHFKKHKIASGGKLDETYHLTSKERFDDMVQNNEFVQFHYRYDRGYGVSLDELLKMKEDNKIPIIHVGKYENIAKFRQFGLRNILSVFIFTDRNSTKDRLIKRHTDNPDEVEKRLSAYDEEIDMLRRAASQNRRLDFDLVIKNNGSSVERAASELFQKIAYFEHNIDSLEDLICL